MNSRVQPRMIAQQDGETILQGQNMAARLSNGARSEETKIIRHKQGNYEIETAKGSKKHRFPRNRN